MFGFQQSCSWQICSIISSSVDCNRLQQSCNLLLMRLMRAGLRNSVILQHTASPPSFLTPALIPHTSPHTLHQPSFLTPALIPHTSPHTLHQPSFLTPALIPHTSPHTLHQPSFLAPALIPHTSPQSSLQPSFLTPPFLLNCCSPSCLPFSCLQYSKPELIQHSS